MKFAFFDFDGTLSQSPLPEEGIQLWEKKSGLKYPHRGWWSKPESLDPILNVKPKPEMVEQLKLLHVSGYTCWVLTNRLDKLEPQIRYWIRKWGLEDYFDGYSFAGKWGNHKGGRVKTIIKTTTMNPTHVVFYDDDPKNLDSVHDACKEIGVEASMILVY